MLPTMFAEYFGSVTFHKYTDGKMYSSMWSCHGTRAKKLSDQPHCRRGERRRLVVPQMHTFINLTRQDHEAAQVLTRQSFLLLISYFLGVFFLLQSFHLHDFEGFVDLFNFVVQSFGGLFINASG